MKGIWGQIAVLEALDLIMLKKLWCLAILQLCWIDLCFYITIACQYVAKVQVNRAIWSGLPLVPIDLHRASFVFSAVILRLLRLGYDEVCVP